MNKAEYAVYLTSEHWIEVRDKKLKASGYKCQVCARKSPLNVHHNTYERLGHELDTDLVVLCRKCHELFHNINKKEITQQVQHKKRKKKKKNVYKYKGKIITPVVQRTQAQIKEDRDKGREFNKQKKESNVALAITKPYNELEKWNINDTINKWKKEVEESKKERQRLRELLLDKYKDFNKVI